MANNHGILLEAGTGELEVLEFQVGTSFYAINVIKVREILHIEKYTKLPNAKKEVHGIAEVRGDVITLIDLNYVLDEEKKPLDGNVMTLLCEFNQMKVAFTVDKVMGIHRIGWDKIQKPDEMVQNSLVIGNINYEERILMLLDFERIVMDIAPQTGITEKRLGNIEALDRSHIKLLLADDSPTIRQVLKDVLVKAGYDDLTFFDDGQKALTYLNELKEKHEEGFINHVHLLITDIEMPKLDGHTLTRRIKEDKILRTLPVVIFSSLITDELKHKGEDVGADAQLSKPQVGKLVAEIDRLIFV